MAEEIINRVARSPLISLDLESFYPSGERILFDLKDLLFQGLILKEKDFRTFAKEHDWSQYEGKNVALICSADAIIPEWAYMLLSTRLEPYANFICFGDLNRLEEALFQKALAKIDPQEYENKKVVVKGCGDLAIPSSAYVEISRILRPVVASLMYGEPCSTVPLYKKPRQ